MKTISKIILSMVCMTAIIICFSSDGSAQQPIMSLESNILIDTVLNDGFEDATLSPFSDGGDASWSVPSGEGNSGMYAARSGSILPGESTYLEYVISSSIPYTISFWYRLNALPVFDQFTFSINGHIRKEDESIQSWKFASFNVAGGQDTIRWNLAKGPLLHPSYVVVDDIKVTTKNGLAFQLRDGTEGFDKILIADAQGRAHWNDLDNLFSSDKLPIVAANSDAEGFIARSNTLPGFLAEQNLIGLQLKNNSDVGLMADSNQMGLRSMHNLEDGFYAEANAHTGFTSVDNGHAGFLATLNNANGFISDANIESGYLALNNQVGYISRSNDQGFAAELNTTEGFKALKNDGYGFMADSNSSDGFIARNHAANSGFRSIDNNSGFSADSNTFYGFSAIGNGDYGYYSAHHPGGFFSAFDDYGFYAFENIQESYVAASGLSNGYLAINCDSNGYVATNNLGDGFRSNSNDSRGFSAENNALEGFRSIENNVGFLADSNASYGFQAVANGSIGMFASDHATAGFYAIDNIAGYYAVDNDQTGYYALGNNGNGLITNANGNHGISATSNAVDGIAVGSNGRHGVRTVSNDADGIYSAGNLGNAGYFSGTVTVTGALSKGSGSFKIDHPLDPENKYLYHSFVESPDMMNVYNGNITTDEMGLAIVTMPEWFDALNKEFRYQLTTIGIFSQAIVKEKLKNNQFTIQTDQPNVEVSWQITGIRKDPYAEQNRIQVEVDKEDLFKGKYLHPEAYSKAFEKSHDYVKLGNKTLQELTEERNERILKSNENK